jgi:predicted nucleic acid-binding protein
MWMDKGLVAFRIHDHIVLLDIPFVAIDFRVDTKWLG